VVRLKAIAFIKPVGNPDLFQFLSGAIKSGGGENICLKTSSISIPKWCD